MNEAIQQIVERVWTEHLGIPPEWSGVLCYLDTPLVRRPCCEGDCLICGPGEEAGVRVVKER